MPYALERWGNKAIVVNTTTGHHYSTNPIVLEKAKAQLRVLKALKEKPKKK